jgi:tektin-2
LITLHFLVTTDITTKWTQHNNNTYLHHRINDVSDWKETLQNTLSATESEIDQLSFTKAVTECALAAKEIPMNVTLECLSIRENRISIDLVRDNVEIELKKEMEVIEGVEGLLHQRISEAFGQLCILQECHQKLHFDITDKHSALEIDSTCLQLTNKSETIDLQKDPTRIKRGIVYPDQWEAFSTYNIARAKDEIACSVKLREAINKTIQQTSNDLESQWTATEYAFRIRIHEVMQALEELEWQKEKTQEEIEKVEGEIEELNMSYEQKIPPMKVAHTRLENRTYRPNVELCRDNPQYALVEEIAEISTSKKQIDEKLTLAKQGLGTLQRTLQRINDDIDVKTQSQKLDEQCLSVRQQLADHPKPHQLPELITKIEKEATAEN